MRLDVFLYKNKYFQSRNKATESILRGEVYLNGVKILKPSFSVDSDSFNKVEILSEKSFVSIGGYKLDKALNTVTIQGTGTIEFKWCKEVL